MSCSRTKRSATSEARTCVPSISSQTRYHRVTVLLIVIQGGHSGTESLTCRFFTFPLISLCKTTDPPDQGHFWPQGYNLNKLGRGPLGDATYQILRLQAFWFQTRRFLKLPSQKSSFSLCDLDMQKTITI